MDYLPLFADLKQRPVLVVGGGEVASRKIDLLLRAGADVQIVAQALHPELQHRYEQHQVTWLAEAFEPAQLDNVFLVIAATDDNVLNATVFDEADRRRVLANVVDDQPKCSFIFPSIVDRSPLVVAISSSGKAPVLARLLLLRWLEAHRHGRVVRPHQVISVPLHRRRQWRRGYNQSDLLAVPLARWLGCGYQEDTLQRTRATPAQRALTAARRQRNLRDAFHCGQNLAGCHVALLDDVVTTGSTVAEICALLNRAGVASIQIWCLCRTL